MSRVTPRFNAYPRWGAYGASKAALHHVSRIWNEELTAEGISVLSLDPGDMDTPLHAAAVPEADRSWLKRPETAAREFADAIGGQCCRSVRHLPSCEGGRQDDSLPVFRSSAQSDAKLLVADRCGRSNTGHARNLSDCSRPGIW